MVLQFGPCIESEKCTRKPPLWHLRKLAALLEDSNQELENFAHIASHDLQEPLRKIMTFADRLKTKCADALSEQGREYLGRMQNAAIRMKTLITDLLSVSQVANTTQTFVSVDLAQIAREVVGDLEARIEQTGASVQVSKLPIIEADSLQMRQLLQNLISNALKYQRPGEVPDVKIESTWTTEQKGRRRDSRNGNATCRIIVKDNGIGFDMKYLDRIFAAFQRLHGRNQYEGTGIGLAVCRKIVERHGGVITAESKPGKGATFIVMLPL